MSSVTKLGTRKNIKCFHESVNAQYQCLCYDARVESSRRSRLNSQNFVACEESGPWGMAFSMCGVDRVAVICVVDFPQGCKQANYAKASDASDFLNAKNHAGMV